MTASEPDSVTLEEARRLLASGDAVLVDVREPDEWEAGHAREALHHPIGDLDPTALPPGVEIITTCRSGGRGVRAAATLRDAGLRARSLDGGMRAWHESGNRLVRDDGSPGSVS